MEEPTVTRAYLAETMYKKIGISISESSEIVDRLFNLITDNFVKNDHLKIAAFGSFNKRYKKQRIGRNPKTKKEAIISARAVVTFNPSRKLRARINSTI
jgi:integration host factor subunit alpha